MAAALKDESPTAAGAVRGETTSQFPDTQSTLCKEKHSVQNCSWTAHVTDLEILGSAGLLPAAGWTGSLPDCLHGAAVQQRKHRIQVSQRLLHMPHVKFASRTAESAAKV